MKVLRWREPHEKSSPRLFGEFILNLPKLMPGPLSPQSINGSPLLYTNPQAYFAARDASKGLAGFGGDTIAGSDGTNDIIGGAGGNSAVASQFGYPTPLQPLDQAVRDMLAQQADPVLKRYGPYFSAGGTAVGAISEIFPLAAEVTEPIDAGLSGIGWLLGNDYLRGILARFYANQIVDPINSAIEDANSAMGNQYLNDAGGMPR